MSNTRCLVLSGEYRTFDKTCDNLLKFIEVNKLDVYCHLWSTDTIEINNIQDRLNPTKLLAEDRDVYQSEFSAIEQRVKTCNPKTNNNDSIAKNASMNFGRKQAFKLVDKKYDELIYTRYDIGFRDTPSFLKPCRDIHGLPTHIKTTIEESYNLISDIFAQIPFEYVDSYFLYDDFEHLLSTKFDYKFRTWLQKVRRYPVVDIFTHDMYRYCPHMTLLRHIYESNVDFSISDLGVYIQR